MFIAAPDESADSAALYKSSADAEGFVMNFSRAWAWRPDVFAGFATLRQQLTSHSALTRRDLAILVCATAAELGDSYCSLAWGRTLATEWSGRSRGGHPEFRRRWTRRSRSCACGLGALRRGGSKRHDRR